MINPIPFPVDIRPADFNDHSFVYGAWLESFKYDANPRTDVPKTWLFDIKWTRYRKLQTKIIENAINNGTIMVASLPDDKDHLVGFAIGASVQGFNVLHYVYVRPNRRRVGLGTHLTLALSAKLGGELVEYSHKTISGKKLADKFKLTYNPLTAITF